jgi:hypothetical protein
MRICQVWQRGAEGGGRGEKGGWKRRIIWH